MSAFLMILAVVLLLVVMLQVGKVIEHIGAIRGEEKSDQEANDVNSATIVITGVITLLFSIVSIFFYDHLFLPESASEMGAKIDKIRNVTLAFTGIVYLITQVLLFSFVWRYRYKKERKAFFFPHNNTMELVWTVIPSIVLVILVVWGLSIWYQIFSPVPENALVIEATAQQFKWDIRYPGEDDNFGPRDLKFVKDINGIPNVLGINWDAKEAQDDFMPADIVLPVNVPVKVKINSLDVLHNFYLPHFRMKMDAVPGIPTSFWFTPIYTTEEMREKTGDDKFEYELACAELCGSAHYNMRKLVRVVTQEEYDAWESEQVAYYKQVIEPTMTTEEVENVEGNLEVIEEAGVVVGVNGEAAQENH